MASRLDVGFAVMGVACVTGRITAEHFPYSSDGKNVGEVTALKRDASGKVAELQAGIGGFIGIGETQVRVTPAQFKLENDRVVLSLTAEQVKALPKIVK
jgi:PRC-barrel domain